MQILKDVLICFSLCSVLQVNFSKSAVFSVGEQCDIAGATNLLQCQIGMLPCIYLGMPLGPVSNRKETWGSVIARVQQELDAGRIKPYQKQGG